MGTLRQTTLEMVYQQSSTGQPQLDLFNQRNMQTLGLQKAAAFLNCHRYLSTWRTWRRLAWQQDFGARTSPGCNGRSGYDAATGLNSPGSGQGAKGDCSTAYAEAMATIQRRSRKHRRTYSAFGESLLVRSAQRLDTRRWKRREPETSAARAEAHMGKLACAKRHATVCIAEMGGWGGGNVAALCVTGSK